MSTITFPSKVVSDMHGSSTILRCIENIIKGGAAVISLNLTKSNPDLRLPQSTLDHSDYSVHPQSPDLGPI